MKMHEIFGERLLPMMEYVGWLESEEGNEVLYKLKANLAPISLSSFYPHVIQTAHRILDQKMDIGWFVKPDDLKHREVRDSRPFIEHVNQSKNWQPMFEGEWKVKGMMIYIRIKGKLSYVGMLDKFQTLNVFATHCINNGIELIINKEYELNEKLRGMKGVTALTVFIFSILTVIPLIAMLIELIINGDRSFIIELVDIIRDPDC